MNGSWPRLSSLGQSVLPEELDAEGDSSSASSLSSTGTVVPSSPNHSNKLPVSPWIDCFDQELFLETPRATYHVYITPPKSSKDPLVVCHHGAGSSGLSFAVFAQEMKRCSPATGVVSVDCRGHGLTDASASDPGDFCLQTLSQDLTDMIENVKSKLNWQHIPSLLLVGHSLGGAVVTDVAKSGIYGSKLIGFAVIDVVEGSALEALKSMRTIMASRPASFPTIEAAIEWHIRSRSIRDPRSARVSVPSLLRQSPSARFWIWRTDLASTQPYWEDWFKGMSSNFLAGKAAKLLILAGAERLDTAMTIGQMQGKFQLEVFPESGHFVQEDSPEKTATIVAEFLRRNDRSTLVLPPKVDDLLKQGKKV